MTPTIKFKSKDSVEVTFTLHVSDLASLLKERSNKLEGRGVRGRPRTVTAEVIAEVLAMKQSGKYTQKQIGEHFGLSAYTISRIVNNRYLADSITIEEEV
jgi:hypothetical protein